MENKWSAAPGYRFIPNQGLVVVWTPGIRYPELYIISGENRNTFKPFLGYTFSKPNKQLSVVWTPGIKDPGHPSQLSGNFKDTWVSVIEQPSSQSSSQHFFGTAAVEAGIAAMVFFLVGDNFLTDYLLKEALANGVKGFTCKSGSIGHSTAHEYW